MEETQSLPLTVRAGSLDREKRTVRVVASTDAVDSYGESMAQNWRLERFKANPVILWSHRSSELPVGQAIDIGIVDGNLEATIKFASAKANPRAEEAFQSFVEGSLRAVSVGFVPHTIRFEMRDDREIVVLDDNELHEISVTPIPANPEALAKMKAKALAAAKDVPPVRGAAGNNKETHMDPEKEIAALKSTVAEKDAKLTGVEKALNDEQAKAKALGDELKKATDDRDAHKKRADEAESKLVESEVDALIGKKLVPAERDEMVKLAKLDKALFRSIVEKRAALPLGPETKMGDAPPAPPTPPTNGAVVATKGLGELALEKAEG